MDAARGRKAPSINDRLLAEGWQFDFVQAAWLLERMNAARAPVGHCSDPKQEATRFRFNNTLSNPASEIYAIEYKAGRHEMTVNIMGLTGVKGALPYHYTESVLKAAGKKNFAPRDFFDLFNHRLISLYYRAAKKGLPTLSFAEDRSDHFVTVLMALLGLGTEGLQQRPEISERELLFYTALIAQRPCSAAVLTAILEDYFSIPVAIEQFQGRWFELDPDDGTSLGREGEGKNNQLGVSATIGDRVWDEQWAFRLVLGPIAYEQMFDFLPDGHAYFKLNQIVRFLVGEEFSFSVGLRLRPPEVRSWQLGSTAQRLGWCTWLGNVKALAARTQRRRVYFQTLQVLQRDGAAKQTVEGYLAKTVRLKALRHASYAVLVGLKKKYRRELRAKKFTAKSAAMNGSARRRSATVV